MSKQTKQQTAIANKIKKWIKTAKEAETETRYFGLSVTRLLSIKSLCEGNRNTAQYFALFIAQKIQTEMNQIERHDYFAVEEWEQDKKLFNEGMIAMQNYQISPNDQLKQTLRDLLKEIEGSQGDDIRQVHWNTTVHFVRSGYLLKLEYALKCFIDFDFPDYAYQLAKQYVETNSNGIMAQSIPLLLDVADFWCQYYFAQNLSQKFPQLMSELN